MGREDPEGEGNELMAIYRNVQMSFWTDPDIIDDYTPDDKLFYLYTLTNPHTNLCGCYEISMKQMECEIGYSREKLESLITKAEQTHNTIRYSRETKELLVLNWSKYNWTSSEKLMVEVNNEIQMIKNNDFKAFLEALVSGNDRVSEIFDRVSDENSYGIKKNSKMTITVTDTDTDINTVDIDNNSISNNKEKDIRKDIIDYLNKARGTNYKPEARIAVKNIHARLKEGYSLEDFYKVIDTKVDEWTGTDFEKYLTPETLFGNKFDKYLNQSPVISEEEALEEWVNSDNTVAPEDEELISDEEYERMMREQYGEDVYIQG